MRGGARKQSSRRQLEKCSLASVNAELLIVLFPVLARTLAGQQRLQLLTEKRCRPCGLEVLPAARLDVARCLCLRRQRLER